VIRVHAIGLSEWGVNAEAGSARRAANGDLDGAAGAQALSPMPGRQSRYKAN
jgi:hypothetical protein